ncbi:MAG: biotin--[acetyl-CoA-carboxylase] ligase [Hyphomonas sp.]|uniref:biotin--[acetyl-CoA-carboxylase] ligase n=1 Tax=Hyphomonas sp. TaxID=87 RepID=UPI00349FF248
MSEPWPVYRMGVIDSTNTEAKRRVAAGFHDQWIVADQQTAGRGRQDRQWISPAGNVYTTAMFREPGGLQVALRLPFAAALAVTDVVLEHAPGADVRVKWPNDVRIDRRKVSGILVETGGAGADFWIAAGMGVNLVPPPENVTQPATSLHELGMRPGTPAEAVFSSLREAFMRRLQQARSGFAGTRVDWLARAEALGQQVQVRAGETVAEGIFEDLEDDGALLLRLPDGSRRTIRAGEIEIGRS